MQIWFTSVVRRSVFLLDWHQIVAENKCWMHVVEYNRSIFDELELELIAKVKVKTCGNLKTPIWHFDDGRSSRPDVFCKKGVLRDFAKSTGKHLCQSLFFNKVAGLRPATLLKKRLWYRCFLVNFVKFLRTPFFSEHLRWLLLLWLQKWGGLANLSLRWSIPNCSPTSTYKVCGKVKNLYLALQACNQEFFRAGKFSWNYGTSINIHLQHGKERSRREKISSFFAWKLLKIAF